MAHIRNDVTTTYHKTRKRWLVRWHCKYDPKAGTQQRPCRSFKRKRDAHKYAQSLKNDIYDGISVEPKTISLKNLCDKFIDAKKGNVSPCTIDSYEDTIERLIESFGAFTNIKTISPQEAQLFVNNLQYLDKEGTLAGYSRLGHMRNSNVIFNQATRWDYIRKNPFKGISIKNLTKEDWHFVNPKEFKALMNVVDNLPLRNKRIDEDTIRKIRLKAYYTVMYGCGLRFGEAINLWWEKNIDFINSQIHIKNRVSKNGFPPFTAKNYQDRSVDCPPSIMSVLQELKKKSSSNNPYVFISDDRLKVIKKKWSDWQKAGNAGEWKNELMENNTNRDFQSYCKKAGIITSDRLSVHTLRKAYGTNLANLSTPVHTLKELMGHSSITTTMKFYLKNSDENKMKAVRGLEGLMEG